MVVFASVVVLVVVVVMVHWWSWGKVLVSLSCTFSLCYLERPVPVKTALDFPKFRNLEATEQKLPKKLPKILTAWTKTPKKIYPLGSLWPISPSLPYQTTCERQVKLEAFFGRGPEHDAWPAAWDVCFKKKRRKEGGRQQFAKGLISCDFVGDIWFSYTSSKIVWHEPTVARLWMFWYRRLCLGQVSNTIHNGMLGVCNCKHPYKYIKRTGQATYTKPNPNKPGYWVVPSHTCWFFRANPCLDNFPVDGTSFWKGFRPTRKHLRPSKELLSSSCQLMAERLAIAAKESVDLCQVWKGRDWKDGSSYIFICWLWWFVCCCSSPSSSIFFFVFLFLLSLVFSCFFCVWFSCLFLFLFFLFCLFLRHACLLIEGVSSV